MSDDGELSELDEGALAARIAASAGVREDAAEAALYRRLAPRVRLYGLRHLRDPHAAADLVQHVLLVAIEHLRAGKVREPGRIASYVLGTARMTVQEMRRGPRRREALLATWHGDDAVDEHRPMLFDQDRLAACLRALSERERSVVVLSFFADRSAEAVGKDLALTAANVRVIRHRALGRLRSCLGIAEDDR